MKKVVLILVIVSISLFASIALAEDDGFYNWTPGLSLSGENPGDGFTTWGQFSMRDRDEFWKHMFWDKEFNAFVFFNSDNMHVNPGAGFRLSLGYRFGNFEPHIAAGLAMVYNATEISSNLTNSFMHATMRAGIDYKRFGIFCDHLSEPFEDDGGITTFGFVIRF
jgi:hypothetical protein